MGSVNDQSQPNTNVPSDSKSVAIPSTQRHGSSITLPSGMTLETPTDGLAGSATGHELLYNSTQPDKWSSEVKFQDGLAVESVPNCFGSFGQVDQHFQLPDKTELAASYAINSNHAYDNFTHQSPTSYFRELNLNDPMGPQVDSRTGSYPFFLPSKSHNSYAINSNHAYDNFTHQSPASYLRELNLNDPMRPQVDSRTGSCPFFLPSKSHSSNNLRNNSYIAPTDYSFSERGYPVSPAYQRHYLDPLTNPYFDLQHEKQSPVLQEISNGGETFKACNGTSLSAAADGRCFSQTGGKEDNGPHWHGYELKQGSEIAHKQVSSRNISANFGQKFPRRISEPNLDPLSMDNFMDGSLQSDGQNFRNYFLENLLTRRITEAQFRKNFNSIDEITGSFCDVAQDQIGCQFLRDKITGTHDDLDKIFVEISDHVVELMMNQFENYRIQKLLDVCTESQLTKMLQEVTKAEGDIFKVCCNQYGTRAMQKIIVSISTPEQFSIIVSSLKSCIVALMKDTNGHHVALSCLDQLPQEYSKLLFDEVVCSCLELAIHKHGCRVLPKYIDIADEEPRRCMLIDITSNSLYLSQDPYGNYVVQHIISGDKATANAVVKELWGNFCELSMQQAASHVVETCLTCAGKDELLCILSDLTSSPSFRELLVHQYGNYVAQKAINVSKKMPFHCDLLVAAIKPYIPMLRNDRFGKRVLACINFKR